VAITWVMDSFGNRLHVAWRPSPCGIVRPATWLLLLFEYHRGDVVHSQKLVFS
jgi:hypothetical protein